MSDELEIARIGAALQIVNAGWEEENDDKPLYDAALGFLIRQFASPEPTQPQAKPQHTGDNVVVFNRCPKVMPGRNSLKLEDGIRCSRQAGHEGPCDFASALSQEQ